MSSNTSMYIGFFIIAVTATACDTAPVVPTEYPAEIAATSPPTPAPEVAPTDIPAPTDTPAPTPIPGVQVYPISFLASSIPWLELDESRRPMSVYFGFNFDSAPFNDVLVRKAFAAAVDRTVVAEMALGFKFREAHPATTLTNPDVLGQNLYGEVGIPFDPEQARAYLAAAGYTDVASFPTVTLLVYMRGEAAPSSYFRMANDAIIPMWKEHLGVTVELVVVDGPGKLRNKIATSNPGMYVLGWGADFVDPDNFLKELFQTSTRLNLGNYSNPAYDALVTRAAEISDPFERLLLYLEAERIITEEDVALIPLFHSLFYIGD